MSLRPRYSLLTLLILTALVAGGVKLWYGPHHVVEQVKPNAEDEYTFTRDWQGNKVIHGPRVLRKQDANGSICNIEFNYYRHGLNTNRLTYIAVDESARVFSNSYYINSETGELELSQKELAEYDDARDNEYQRLMSKGFQKKSFSHWLNKHQ